MEVRPGYKQTEAGVIPVDWDAKAIGTFALIKTGPFGTLLKAHEYTDGDGVPLISVGEVRQGFLRVTDKTPRIPPEVVRRLPQYVLRKGDIVFGRKGAVERSAYIQPCQDGWFLGSDGISIRPANGLHGEYLAFQFQSHRTQEWLRQNSIGTTMPSLNQQILKRAEIPLPPTLAEQEAIAEALSDADALIESMAQLLTKQRQIKQGAMQELLTGKKRLPGFKGKWVVKRLGNLCNIAIGRTPSRLDTAFWGDGCKWLSIADLKAKVVCDSKEEITSVAAESMQVVRKGTLLMSFKLSIGRLSFAGCDLYTNEAICSFNSLKEDANFLYYILGRTDFSLYGKQAVKGYTLNKESLRFVEVRLPPIEEQTAIASVFSDMDAEIEALEKKLTKARQTKQGMMQELLRGRIRLV